MVEASQDTIGDRPRKAAETPSLTRLRAMPALRIALVTSFALSFASAAFSAVPAVPFPAENPFSEAKRVLGKILFWDEQLSSDGSVACGTCHAPAAGGADPAPAIHPGADLIFGNADDVLGSLGVVRRDVSGTAISDPVFGFNRQVTRRSAPSFFGGLWSPENFWDGRAGDQFLDPITSSVVIVTGGALENQAVGPILSSVEMAKDGRTWSDVTSRLATVVPLGAQTGIPADVAAALLVNPNYPDLFALAFGDSAITPTRIAFAIATYERTLVADQTPWDEFEAGNTAALTLAQQQGMSFYNNSTDCAICHPAPLFTDHSFRNVGVRDSAEDTGREEVTALAADEGKFKTPTLRNIGLRPNLFHTGDSATVTESVTFYETGNHVVGPNLDPLMPVDIPGFIRARVIDFLENGLTDPRVAAETFPFDRPNLVPEPAAGGMLIAGGLLLRMLGGRRLKRRATRLRD